MGTLVMKFGGLSVGTTTALTQVLSIVLHERERWENLLIVVSALEGVTDALVEATRLAQLSNRRGYRRIAATLRTRHLALIDHLPLGTNERQAILADVDRLLFEMLDELQSVADANYERLTQQTMDSIIGVGERLAARIVAALIRQNSIRAVAIDSDDLIITDNNFGNATPNIEESRQRIQKNLLPMMERRIVPVITGFIGLIKKGELTTLGRGGTDYTASVVAACAKADEVWIWTDVDGMMTTDPRDIETARVIPMMSYNEVGEMAYFGARVLHARMVGPLKQNNIPLRIKNVFKPQQPGTLIFTTNPKQMRSPKAVTTIQALGLTGQRSGPLSEIAAMVNDVLVHTAGSPAEVMISSQSSDRSFMCFIIPTTSGPGAIRASIDMLRQQLQATSQDEFWKVAQVSVVTVVGAGLNETPADIAELFKQITDTHILALAQGPSHCSMSIVVDPDDTFDVLTKIHRLLLSRSD